MAPRLDLEAEARILNETVKGVAVRYRTERGGLLVKYPHGAPDTNEKGFVFRSLAQLRAARGV